MDKYLQVGDTLFNNDFVEVGDFERHDFNSNPLKTAADGLSIGKNTERIREIKILKTVMGLMGVRYRKNGADSGGFDCSGFISRIFLESCGILMPHSSREQYKFGKHVNREDLRFGDLVFFTLYGKLPSHVGIYIGDGLFAHASINKGVTISLLNSEYYLKKYFGACRILK